MKKQIFTLMLACGVIVNTYAQAPRKVVVEDYTGIWCGWCPNGRTASEHLMSTFGSQVICMGVHSSDALSTGYPDNIVNGMQVPGFPMGSIDRHNDPSVGGGIFQGCGATPACSDWDQSVTDRLNTTAPLSVSITSTYNSFTRAMTATVTANFVASASGNMNINCVLVEDSIETDGQQHNYMTDNTYGNFVGWEWYGKGNPITTYQQRDVARTNLSASIIGDAGVIPTSVSSGGNYSHSYTYTIPSGWNASHVKIVGFVCLRGTSTTAVDTANMTIMNAEEVRLGASTLTGIVEAKENGFNLGNAYPNPFNTVISIPLEISESTRTSIKIFNLLGEEVTTLIDEELTAGAHTFYWNGTHADGSAAASGMYFFRVTTAKGSASKTLLLNR
ncbi:MAG TPA: Omp28-related outer membrane protein [Bacteroidia bacterium]|nr:Omp28-related outer membrane protein [Bacteroidia bacterium]